MDTNYVSAGQDSVIGLVTRWTVLGSIPDGVDFSAPAQSDPGTHLVSCTMGMGSFPW